MCSQKQHPLLSAPPLMAGRFGLSTGTVSSLVQGVSLQHLPSHAAGPWLGAPFLLLHLLIPKSPLWSQASAISSEIFTEWDNTQIGWSFVPAHTARFMVSRAFVMSSTVAICYRSKFWSENWQAHTEKTAILTVCLLEMWKRIEEQETWRQIERWQGTACGEGSAVPLAGSVPSQLKKLWS